MQLWTLLISPTTSFPHFNISPILMYTVLAKTSSQTKIKNKKVLNFIKQVFFLLLTEGSLGDIRAYLALHLGGTPSQETGISPPSCLLLENRLYMLWALSFYQLIGGCGSTTTWVWGNSLYDKLWNHLDKRKKETSSGQSFFPYREVLGMKERKIQTKQLCSIRQRWLSTLRHCVVALKCKFAQMLWKV